MILKHEHLLVRGELYTPVKSQPLVETWLKDLIASISMEILVGPFSVYSTMIGNTGITAGAILSTSHVVLHTFEDEDMTVLQLDLYSCSCIDVELVMREITKFFHPYKLEFKFLDRETSLAEKSID